MIEPESVETPEHMGDVTVIRAERQPSGIWGVDLHVDLVIQLEDGRQVIVNKIVRVRATQQLGRKPRKDAA